MSEHMKIFTDTDWTTAGLVLFVLLFVIFVLFTGLESQKKIHSKMSRLPLESDSKEALS